VPDQGEPRFVGSHLIVAAVGGFMAGAAFVSVCVALLWQATC